MRVERDRGGRDLHAHQALGHAAGLGQLEDRAVAGPVHVCGVDRDARRERLRIGERDSCTACEWGTHDFGVVAARDPERAAGVESDAHRPIEPAREHEPGVAEQRLATEHGDDLGHDAETG